MTIKEIQAAATYEYTRFDYTHMVSGSNPIQSRNGPQSVEFIDRNAVQLSSSLNIEGVGTIKKRGSGGDAGSLVVDSGVAEENRWVIQTKFETPMLNFNHISGSDHITLPVQGSGSVPRGMWHQYGRIPEENEGVILQVSAIPANYQFQVMNKTMGAASSNNGLMKDMSEVLGFSNDGTKLGRLAQRKEISEAVVAVPFIEKSGRKKFFTLEKAKIDTYKLGLTAENEDAYRKLTNGEPSEQIGRSVLNQIEKMKKYIFPPSFDFVNFDTDKVKPVAMYIFEFSHTLTQEDLQDIWQNLPPTIGTEMEVAEVAITHPLLKKELLGPGGESGTATIEMPDNLKWMVFKVKKRASSNYFKKTVLRNSEINTEVDSGNVTQDEFGQTSTIQYNWPYDFFSLVEMVRIDAEVEMGNADFSSYTDNIPNWDPVQAEREKIAVVVGGLEDEPVPDTELPESLSEPVYVGPLTSNLGLTTVGNNGLNVEPSGEAVAESVSSGFSFNVSTGDYNSNEDSSTEKARIHANREYLMKQWKERFWSKYNSVSALSRESRRVRLANEYAESFGMEIGANRGAMNGKLIESEVGNAHRPGNAWYYKFDFHNDGLNYSSEHNIPKTLRY